MNMNEAAARLGVPEKEVVHVEDAPTGVVITTADGVSYIIVGNDTPDAEGKTSASVTSSSNPGGLMLLAAPAPSFDRSSFPIFAQETGLADGEENAAVELDPLPVDELPSAKASKAEWLAYAISQGGDADTAAALTRNALAAHYGAK